MVLYQVSLKLFGGSGEEEENVKSLWQQRRPSNGQQTNCDQKSLLEPSAQVSLQPLVLNEPRDSIKQQFPTVNMTHLAHKPCLVL